MDTGGEDPDLARAIQRSSTDVSMAVSNQQLVDALHKVQKVKGYHLEHKNKVGVTVEFQPHYKNAMENGVTTDGVEILLNNFIESVVGN